MNIERNPRTAPPASALNAEPVSNSVRSPVPFRAMNASPKGSTNVRTRY